MDFKISSSLLLATLILTPLQVIANDMYQLDHDHSYVSWHVNHFGYSNPTGKWMVEGTLKYDKNAPENSEANVTINMANIITGIPELDKHLKGKLFFEVETFPKATFVSNKVKVVDNQITEVSGIVTIHGIARPITLTVKQNKIAKNPITEKPTIGFSAETSLNRSDFGIKTLLPGVSDEVKLNIEVEGIGDSE